LLSTSISGKSLQDDKQAQAALPDGDEKPQVQAQPQVQAKVEQNSFDAELSEVVGLKQNPEANKELLNKLKAFESEAKNTNEMKNKSWL